MRSRAILMVAIFFAGCALACVRPGSAQQEAAGGPSSAGLSRSAIRAEHNAETFTTKINIRSEGGRVAWSDVLRGLARARGYDDTALAGLLPDRSFRFTGLRGSLIRGGLNLALGPHVRFGVETPEGESAAPWLVIELDRAALLASERRFKAWLRDKLLSTRKDAEPRTFGLVFDGHWDDAPAGRNLVVGVHGIASSPERVAGLLAGPRSAGFPCAVFSYPNDQPIADSARLLAGQLAALAEEHPDRGVSLLTHSMGGLVARAAVEDPELDPGNVRQLIMIAPPNHGSALARFHFGLELAEQVANQVRKAEIRGFYASIEDGLAEAAEDLRPDSPFLRELNSRPRNANVAYTIFLGTGAWLSEQELEELRHGVAAAGERSRWARFFGPRVDEWLADLDEVVAGKGDGAVSVERGRLDGVADTLVLDFGHLNVLESPARGDVERVHRDVLQRLRGTQ